MGNTKSKERKFKNNSDKAVEYEKKKKSKIFNHGSTEKQTYSVKQLKSKPDIKQHISNKYKQSQSVQSLYNKRIRYTIYGYTRRTERLLFMLLSDDIKAIMCKFYDASDTWNKIFTRKNILIKENYIKMSKNMKGGGTAYGNKIIKSGDYYYCQLTLKGNFDALYVGIIHDKPHVLNTYQYGKWDWNAKGYGYVLNCKYKGFRSPNDCYPGISYGGEWYKDGDVLEMMVDLTDNNANIAFVINGKNYGIVDVEISKYHSYRLAVCIFDMLHDASIQLL
eukprot:168445_1